MKKILIFIFSLFISLFAFTSCATGGDNMPHSKETDHSVADKTIGQIVNAVESKDSSIMKLLFSKNLQLQLNDLEKNTLLLFDFVQGEVVDFSSASEAGIGVDSSVQHGLVRKEILSSFSLRTTEGIYYVAIKQCVRDDSNSNNIGIISIYIIDAKAWNQDYIYRGDSKWTPGINIQ